MEPPLGQRFHAFVNSAHNCLALAHGEWLVSTRYSSWEVYGKVQEGWQRTKHFAKLWAHATTFAELTGRNIAVGIDL